MLHGSSATTHASGSADLLAVHVGLGDEEREHYFVSGSRYRVFSPPSPTSLPYDSRRLAGPKEPIARVPKAWQDVPVRIELAVERCAIDGYIGMRFRESSYSLRRSDEAQKANSRRPRSFE